MPEGDTIHKAAAKLRPALEGATLVRFEAARASGPMPRPGTTITAVEAQGKYLLVRFADGHVLQTHMKMTGRWDLYRTGERWWKPAHLARAVIEVDGHVAVCFSAPVVRIIRVKPDDRELDPDEPAAAPPDRPPSTWQWIDATAPSDLAPDRASDPVAGPVAAGQPSNVDPDPVAGPDLGDEGDGVEGVAVEVDGVESAGVQGGEIGDDGVEDDGIEVDGVEGSGVQGGGVEDAGPVAVADEPATAPVRRPGDGLGSHRDQRFASLDHLGPDLCVVGVDLDAALRRMTTIAAPDDDIADVLLDQRVAAGVGNVFKSEVLWACRLHPLTPLAQVDAALRRQLLETAAAQLQANLTTRRRTTVAGPPGSLAVYHRSRRPCRRCGTPIRWRRTGRDHRSTYWCPRCQPEPDRA